MLASLSVSFVGSASVARKLHIIINNHIITIAIASICPRLHDGQPTQQQQLTDAVVTAHPTA
jgi:hypothetical protein